MSDPTPNTDPAAHEPERMPPELVKLNGTAPPGKEIAKGAAAEVIPIKKPTTTDLSKFKSKRGQAGGSVGVLQSALPLLKIAEAKDFVRLHPNEELFWSDELCFVNVPIKGQKRDLLHLITEDVVPDLVMPEVQRFRLALASKPGDVFFLVQIPTQNLDNSWNLSALQACELGKTAWVKCVSSKDDGAECYKIIPAKDPDFCTKPKWPEQSLDDLIAVSFGPNRMIEHEDHPAILRLIGAKQSLS
jgi:hypothetical protein